MALSGQTVTVRCFVPHGVTIYKGPGEFGVEPVTLAGPQPVSLGFGTAVEHRPHGFGVTTVPIEVWNSWFAAHANGPLVRNGGVALVDD